MADIECIYAEFTEVEQVTASIDEVYPINGEYTALEVLVRTIEAYVEAISPSAGYTVIGAVIAEIEECNE